MTVDRLVNNRGRVKAANFEEVSLRGALVDGTMDAVITERADDTISRHALFVAGRNGQSPATDPDPIRTRFIVRENLPPSAADKADQPARVPNRQLTSGTFLQWRETT